jgi:hypothetical protein
MQLDEDEKILLIEIRLSKIQNKLLRTIDEASREETPHARARVKQALNKAAQALSRMAGFLEP